MVGGQAECRDEGADEARARQVHAFGKRAAQHGKGNALSVRANPSCRKTRREASSIARDWHHCGTSGCLVAKRPAARLR